MREFRGPVWEAFERWNDVRNRADCGSRDYQTAREYWSAVADVLSVYSSEKNGARTGDIIENFPPYVAVSVERAIRSIIAGSLPELLSVLLRPGAPSATPDEVNDKKAAVLYVKAVQEKLIKDCSPNKTVCEEYGVGAQTVRDWCRHLPVSLDEFLPDASPDDRAEIIGKRMRRAGQRFKQAGGSRQAIAKRATGK